MTTLGFTGTRSGMSRAQRATVETILRDHRPTVVHHGDCIGSDADFHTICRAVDPAIRIVVHPPTNATLRAWCAGDELLPVMEYLRRNHAIVDACTTLVATPGEFASVLRSGTWATIRYALSRERPFLVVYPDGRVAS